jgi:hypothetical protein
MKVTLAVLLVIIAVFAARIFLSPPADNSVGKPVEGLPWQIQVQPDGDSKVAGLTLGVSTMADARSRFGRDVQVAIVAAPGEIGNAEAFFYSVTFGAVSGKALVTADIAPKEIESMRQRAAKVEYMESSTKKWTLAPEDLTTVYAAPIRTLTFIPAANLDEQIVLERFGKPAERIRASEHTEHFLYPALGLDLILDSKGKEVLQYVPPKRFAELRAPLLAKH